MLASSGNRLYLLGGATLDATGAVTCVSTVESYAPLTDTWTTLAPLPTPRAEAGHAILSNQIYVVGGYCWDSNRRLDSVEVFDINSNRWHSACAIEKPYTGVGCCALTLYHNPDQLPMAPGLTSHQRGADPVENTPSQQSYDDVDGMRPAPAVKASQSEDNITVRHSRSLLFTTNSALMHNTDTSTL